jgi:hypothetical protein
LTQFAAAQALVVQEAEVSLETEEVALETDRIEAEVTLWAEETNGLLSSCRRLIEYFGDPSELASWDKAIALPKSCLDAARDALTAKIHLQDEWRTPDGAETSFRCSEPVARIVSPIVQVIGEPIADFVYTIRETAPPAEQGALLFPYGSFCMRFGNAIATPLWKEYPQLAPEEWRATVRGDSESK